MQVKIPEKMKKFLNAGRGNFKVAKVGEFGYNTSSCYASAAARQQTVPTAEAEREEQAMEDHERSFMLAVFLDGELVGNCGINTMSDHFKMRHRASLGISIKKKAWGLGIGTLLMEKALEQAKENGFTQVELGVFADNDRARHLYRKLGFTEMGCIPKAFCLKDGTYRDEVQMVKFLTD